MPKMEGTLCPRGWVFYLVTSPFCWALPVAFREHSPAHSLTAPQVICTLASGFQRLASLAVARTMVAGVQGRGRRRSQGGQGHTDAGPLLQSLRLQNGAVVKTAWDQHSHTSPVLPTVGKEQPDPRD
jgi:hypothetical protein